MGIALSTAGITVGYAVEATAGTRPTTGYTILPDIQSIPDLDPSPNNIDVTTLAETEWMQYIAGLKDTGGAIALGCLNTNAFQTAWGDLVDAYEAAILTDKATWFEVKIPGLDNSFSFSGIPSALGLAAAAVNAAATVNGNITPTKIAGWAAKSTTTTG